MHDYSSHALVFLSPSPLDAANAPPKFSPAAGPARGWADIPVALPFVYDRRRLCCAPGQAWRLALPFSSSPVLPLPLTRRPHQLPLLPLPILPTACPPACPVHRTLSPYASAPVATPVPRGWSHTFSGGTSFIFWCHVSRILFSLNIVKGTSRVHSSGVNKGCCETAKQPAAALVRSHWAGRVCTACSCCPPLVFHNRVPYPHKSHTENSGERHTRDGTAIAMQQGGKSNSKGIESARAVQGPAAFTSAAAAWQLRRPPVACRPPPAAALACLAAPPLLHQPPH
jgi:hypothetical protein